MNKKKSNIVFFIFLACAIIAIGLTGYFIIKKYTYVSTEGARKFVAFNSIESTDNYLATISQDGIEKGKVVYQVQKEKSDKRRKGDFKFTLTAEINGTKVAQETYYQDIITEYDETNKIDCTIKDYSITFFNGKNKRTFLDEEVKGVNKNAFFFTVTEYFDEVFNCDCKYVVSCTPIDSLKNEIYGTNGESLSQSKEVIYTAFYKEDFLKRENFYYNGAWYDYIINSPSELEILVWKTILYREGTESAVTFYIECGDINQININVLVFNAIDSYPEYSGVNSNNKFAAQNGNIGKLFNFTYYLPSDHTETFVDLAKMDEDNGTNYYDEALKNIRENDSSFNQDYIRYGTGENYERTFDINSSIDEVEVYNTEQLFMVVQSGGKPVFNDTNSVCYKVYQNALKVLKEVNNSDLLTDYEKSLNIYRYITSNIVYDYVTYNYMFLKNDLSIKNFGKFSCFYLEGVFGDKVNNTNYAVCDGLAKAYSLMCNIEGIECKKINGEVVEYSGNVGHSWNKIKLSDDKYNANGYYYVDTTWGQHAYRNSAKGGGYGSTYQILTHTYFLFPYEKCNRIINYPKNDEKVHPSSKFEYYKSIKYEYKGQTFDSYIESDEELKLYLTYANSKISLTNTIEVCELKFSDEYFANNNSLIWKAGLSINDLVDGFTLNKCSNICLTGENVIIYKLYK